MNIENLKKEGTIDFGYWEGGNDNGWIDTDAAMSNSLLDDFDIDKLEKKCYDILGYGSWAGNFESTGRIVIEFIDKEHFKVCLQGDEASAENPNVVETLEHYFKIPPKFPLRNLSVEISGDNMDGCAVNVSAHVVNGLFTDELNELLQNLEKEIDDVIEQAISNDVRFWENVVIPYTQTDFKNGKECHLEIECLEDSHQEIIKEDVFPISDFIRETVI